MSNQLQTTGSENGKVLAASSLVAGVAGGISVLMRGRGKASKEQQALARIVEERRKELAEVNSTLETRRKELSDLLINAGKQGRKTLQNANVPTIDMAEVDWSALSRRARKGIERARVEAVKHVPSDLNGRGDALRKSGGDAAKSARTLGERAAEQIAKRASELLESAEAELSPRAKTVSDRASVAASSAIASSKEAAGSIRNLVDDARPQLEDLATRARDAAKHSVEDAKPRIDELSAKAKSVVSHAPDAFTAEFHKAEEALGALASGVQEKTAEAAQAVELKSKASAKAVRKGGKEGTSMLFWLGTAASVTYFVILSDEQRDQVRHVVGRVINEAREIYADIQGEDGKF